MKKSFFLFLITAILFSGCFDSPDKLTGSITIFVDGEERTAKEPVGFLEFEESNGHEARYMSVSGYFPGTGENINIVVRNYDFQSPPAKGVLEKPYYNSTLPAGEALSQCEDVGGGVTLCDHGVVLYVLNGDTYTSNFDENSYVEITLVKTDSKKIYGEFAVQVSGSAGDVFITGIFENVSYTIQ